MKADMCVDHNRTNKFLSRPSTLVANAMSTRSTTGVWFTHSCGTMHENGFVTAPVTTWSLLGQVERLRWESDHAHHGIRETHSHVQLDIHHVWQRCVGRCKHLHLQRLELRFSSQLWWKIDRVGWAEREHVPSGVDVQERQATTATSSVDSEAIEWSSAVKTGIRIAEMLEFSRIGHPKIIGRTDNDSLRLAVERGSSTKFGDLRKTAEVNFSFLKITQIPLGRVDTSENYADSFTKTLSSTKLQCLPSLWYMLGVNRNNNSQAVLNVEFHRQLCGYW